MGIVYWLSVFLHVLKLLYVSLGIFEITQCFLRTYVQMGTNIGKRARRLPWHWHRRRAVDQRNGLGHFYGGIEWTSDSYSGSAGNKRHVEKWSKMEGRTPKIVD